jgi:hypothetical protein
MWWLLPKERILILLYDNFSMGALQTRFEISLFLSARVVDRLWRSQRNVVSSRRNVWPITAWMIIGCDPVPVIILEQGWRSRLTLKSHGSAFILSHGFFPSPYKLKYSYLARRNL